MADIHTIALAAQAGVPVAAKSKPGEGKSRSIEALGRATNRHTETLILSIRGVEELGGLPFIDKKTDKENAVISSEVRLAPPIWAQNLIKRNGGILFFDEITTAAPAKQAGAMKIILDGVVGDTVLPHNTWRIAAYNPPEMAAGGFELSPPMANRLIHLNWTLTADQFIQGMMTNWPDPAVKLLPSQWELHLPLAQSRVAAYIERMRGAVHEMPDDEAAAGGAWPSPRTWSFVSRIVAACESIDAPEDQRIELICGCVGQGRGLEFYVWLKELNLPNPEELLSDPSSFRLPARGDIRFAVLSSIIAAVVNRPTRDRNFAAWEILSRSANQGGRDVAGAVCQPLARLLNKNPELGIPHDHIHEFIPLLEKSGMWGNV